MTEFSSGQLNILSYWVSNKGTSLDETIDSIKRKLRLTPEAQQSLGNEGEFDRNVSVSTVN